jgi:hypothetical protein
MGIGFQFLKYSEIGKVICLATKGLLMIGEKLSPFKILSATGSNDLGEVWTVCDKHQPDGPGCQR